MANPPDTIYVVHDRRYGLVTLCTSRRDARAEQRREPDIIDVIEYHRAAPPPNDDASALREGRLSPLEREELEASLAGATNRMLDAAGIVPCPTDAKPGE